MNEKLQEKDSVLTDSASPEEPQPKQDGAEREPLRCPDNYSFEDGM